MAQGTGKEVAPGIGQIQGIGAGVTVPPQGIVLAATPPLMNQFLQVKKKKKKTWLQQLIYIQMQKIASGHAIELAFLQSIFPGVPSLVLLLQDKLVFL